ncbi:mannonate dehydratase, partial [Bacillus altitudinis]|uniref:mannonate dehydratase n=1 Tax=Bacillus altitudinis TaxID=293387 RepID=UPI001F206414
MKGIVSGVYDVGGGDVWGEESIGDLKGEMEGHDVGFEVVESVGVDEDIKVGKGRGDVYMEDY